MWCCAEWLVLPEAFLLAPPPFFTEPPLGFLVESDTLADGDESAVSPRSSGHFCGRVRSIPESESTCRYKQGPFNDPCQKVVLLHPASSFTIHNSSCKYCFTMGSRVSIYAKTVSFSCSYFISTVKLWNSVPSDIVNCTNLSSFKRALKYLYLT